MALDPISSIGSAVADVGNMINNIVDAGKKRDMQRAFGMLSQEQQDALNKQVAAQSSDDARMSVLVNGLTQYMIANQAAQASSDTQKLWIAVTVGALSVVLLIWATKK